MPPFISQILPDAAAAAAALGTDLVHWIETTPGVLNIAISGGRTPETLFRILAGERCRRAPWNRVRFFWADERWVSHDNPESNFGNARRLLLEPLAISPDHMFPMSESSPQSMEEADIHAAAKRYSALLRRSLPTDAGVPIFDLILLGMGADGHTASLFPGVEPEAPSDPCSATRHPQTGAPRLTLTLPVLNQARHVVFLVTGADKAAALRDLRSGKSQSPAARVRPKLAPAAWYIDMEAGR